MQKINLSPASSHCPAWLYISFALHFSYLCILHVHKVHTKVCPHYCLQINSVVDEHIKYASSTIDSSVWEAIHDEGEMKVYRREMEEDGMIVDPLKAVHSVQVGVL